MNKKYQLYCEICNWKKITDGSDVHDLTPVKKSKIQRGIPRLDAKTKKKVEPKWKNMPKQFKCPECGRPVKIKRIADPQHQLELRLEKEAANAEREKIKLQIMNEMKDRYKERREKEIIQAEKDAETRRITRELEEERLREEIEKIKGIEKEKEKGFGIEVNNEEENRTDGSETSSEG